MNRLQGIENLLFLQSSKRGELPEWLKERFAKP